ncbi:DNA-directed RNA polymerase subunit alpha [Candidatus Roizmanbacteria bacterium]|nr:DNA-directed RNA polymerase subunit alpha [Candidatus Roizmanbacteria bacterium]
MFNPNFSTEKVEESATYGKFILEPLPLSFGQSLGHALRRTLLSSLLGAAITNVKIEGVSHLFSTLKGIKESALEVMLNLKELKFDAKGEGPFKVELKAKGPGKIYGKDLEGEIKPVNTDVYIAEITDEKGKLELEAIVEVGMGYSSVEEREKKEYGFTPVDAFFSPVKKVNFKVTEARVGRKTNFDRLTLEVWTDGSIKPSECLKKSTEILANFFAYFMSGKDTPKLKVEQSEEEVKQELIDKKLYEIIIDELSLPSRVINALLREHIETVADLVKVGKEQLTNMKGVGKKSIELIEEELKKMGIQLS